MERHAGRTFGASTAEYLCAAAWFASGFTHNFPACSMTSSLHAHAQKRGPKGLMNEATLPPSRAHSAAEYLCECFLPKSAPEHARCDNAQTNRGIAPIFHLQLEHRDRGGRIGYARNRHESFQSGAQPHGVPCRFRFVRHVNHRIGQLPRIVESTRRSLGVACLGADWLGQLDTDRIRSTSLRFAWPPAGWCVSVEV